MSSVSWYLFMSPFMLSLHLFFGRPLFLLPETSSLSDFAQIWSCSHLKQWPNLVFPIAHLNILISAELSLRSSFFFTGQHSEPYVIAGLTILSFNYTGIFLSHITPDTSFHCIHPILIILFTSACLKPFHGQINASLGLLPSCIVSIWLLKNPNKS